MHPHLVGDTKRQHCQGIIEALQECHKLGFLSKVTGHCNGIKHELNLCLREERLARTAANREDAKARKAKTEEAWKQIDEER